MYDQLALVFVRLFALLVPDVAVAACHVVRVLLLAAGIVALFVRDAALSRVLVHLFGTGDLTLVPHFAVG